MKRFLGRRFRRTTLAAAFCVAVLGGIGLARISSFAGGWIFVAGLFAALTLKRRQLPALMAAVLVGLCIGGLRGTIYMHQLAAYEALFNQKVVITGRAANDATYGKHSQLAFDITDAHVVGTRSQTLIGKIGVSGFGVNTIYHGDSVTVSGKLRPGTGARQAWMSYASLGVSPAAPSTVDNLRRRFTAGMQSALPEPAASFGMGLLVGQHSTLPDDVYQQLLMVGLIHIIAVSGYNLTILLRASRRLLGRRSKYQTLILSAALIGVFLLFTGSSASIVRAAIVSLLSLGAWYYGRTFKPILLLLLAGVITGYANPLYEWSDIGWYLSFLAFYGVLVLAPQVRARWLAKRWQDSLVFSIALESLCAEIMTLPLILYIFGQLSFASLLANVLVAAFVPLAMLLALIAGLAGMLIAPIAGWFAWPALLVLTYMLDVAHLLAGIPHVFVQNVVLPLTGMLLLYAFVVFVSLVLHGRGKAKGGIITESTEENPALQPSYL